MTHRRINTAVQPPLLDLATVRPGDVIRADDAWGCLDRGDVLVRQGGDGALYARRRFMLAATISHIDAQIAGTPGALPFHGAARLLARMIDGQVATLTEHGPSRTLSVWGVAATTDASSAHGLLREWQRAAKDRLGRGM